jgi:hypothetical protein
MQNGEVVCLLRENSWSKVLHGLLAILSGGLLLLVEQWYP